MGGGEEARMEEAGSETEMCVCARARVCVCGLDEPPEFTLQLWSFSGGRRENEKRRNKVRAGRKSRT